VKLKKTAAEMSSLLHDMCRENTLSRTCVPEWHKRFTEGRKGVEDE